MSYKDEMTNLESEPPWKIKIPEIAVIVLFRFEPWGGHTTHIERPIAENLPRPSLNVALFCHVKINFRFLLKSSLIVDSYVEPNPFGFQIVNKYGEQSPWEGELSFSEEFSRRQDCWFSSFSSLIPPLQYYRSPLLHFPGRLYFHHVVSYLVFLKCSFLY